MSADFLEFDTEAEAILEQTKHPGSKILKPRGRHGRVKLRIEIAETVRTAVADAFDEHRPKPPTPEALATWSLGPDIMTRVIPAQEYAIRPYLPLGCATGLSGQGKVGKSFVSLQMMLAVAAGRPFMGCAVTAGPVWYFSAEDKPERVMERAQAILREFTEEERSRAIANFHAIDAVGKRLFFVATIHGAAQITTVCERIAATVGKAVLIVVDTVSRINPLPENSNEGMALVVSAAEVIASRTGAAVVLNHHVGKSQARGGETDMYAGRGASSFGDNCRSVLTLSHATDAQVRTFDERTQEQQRLNNVRVLTHSAASYGREAAAIYLLRRDNGTFEKLNPVTDLFSPLQDWLRTKGLTAFSQRMLLRNHTREIWNPAPSRAEIEKFIGNAIAAEVFISAGKAQGGGEQYRLNPASSETVTALDGGVIQDIEGTGWLQ